MPTTEQRQVVVEYSDWAQGPQFAFNRRAGVGNTGYTCEMMHLYHDGSLGVIPGLKEWNHYTGWTSTWTAQQTAQLVWHPKASDYRGQLWVLGAQISAGADKVLFHDFATPTWGSSAALEAVDPSWASWSDKSPQSFSTDQSIAGSAGTYLAGGVQHVLSLNDRVFAGELRLNSAGAASTFGWTETDPMANWVEYRGRVYAWKGADGDHPTRVWYSDIDNYQAQTSSLQYFDVGISSNSVYIKGAWSLRDSILFCLSNNDWYAYSGVPGASQLRFVGRYIGPAHQAAGVVLGNELYFLSPIDFSPCVATPQGVDSVTFASKQLRDLAYDALERIYPARAIASVEQESVLLTAGILTSFEANWYALELSRGVWFAHKYLTGSSTLTDLGHLIDACTVANGRAYAFLTRRVLGQDENQRLRLFTRDVRLDRPGNNSDGLSAGRTLRASLTLAPFAPKPGNEARVQNVVVEGRYWKGTGYATPGILCSGLTAPYTLGSLPDASTGAEFRHVFRNEADVFEASPQVTLNNMDSVSIDRVIVEYEVRPINHWLGQEDGS